MVGGYIILDLKGANLPTGSGGVTVPGVYEKIEASIGKPILLRNFSVNGNEQHALFATAYDNAGSYVIFIDATTSSIRRIVVNNSDFVIYRAVGFDGAGTPQEDGPSASM